MNSFFASLTSGGSLPPTPPILPVIGDLINDTFAGGALSGWDHSGDGGLQNITVSGGSVRVAGLRADKTLPLQIENTAYAWSTLQQFSIETAFKFNAFGANGYGAYIGAHSRDVGCLTSVYAWIDPKSATFNIIACAGTTPLYSQASAVIAVDINTADEYLLRLTFGNGGLVTAHLENTSRAQIQEITNQYIYTTTSLGAGYPFRPNVWRYVFGVAGSSDVSFRYYKASSTEKKNGKGVFIGDSITVGAYSGGFVEGFAPQLVAAAKGGDLWQIMAGNGNKASDIVNNLAEILVVNPANAFINIGTNDSADAQTNIPAIVTALQGAGITIRLMPTPNGGNPLTGGTFNYWLKNTYPSLYFDLWTTGWNAMAGGDMYGDGIHPLPSGHIRLANAIRAGFPALFA